MNKRPGGPLQQRPLVVTLLLQDDNGQTIYSRVIVDSDHVKYITKNSVVLTEFGRRFVGCGAWAVLIPA